MTTSIDQYLDRHFGVVGTHTYCNGTVVLKTLPQTKATFLECDKCGGRSGDSGFEVKVQDWLKELVLDKKEWNR